MPVVKRGGSINSDLLCNLSTFDNMQQSNMFGGKKPSATLVRVAKAKPSTKDVKKGGNAATSVSGNDFRPPLGLPASSSGQLSQYSDIPTMITPAMQQNFVYPFYYDKYAPLLTGGKKTAEKTKTATKSVTKAIKSTNKPRTPSIPSPRLPHSDASFVKTAKKRSPTATGTKKK